MPHRIGPQGPHLDSAVTGLALKFLEHKSRGLDRAAGIAVRELEVKRRKARPELLKNARIAFKNWALLSDKLVHATDSEIIGLGRKGALHQEIESVLHGIQTIKMAANGDKALLTSIAQGEKRIHSLLDSARERELKRRRMYNVGGTSPTEMVDMVKERFFKTKEQEINAQITSLLGRIGKKRFTRNDFLARCITKAKSLRHDAYLSKSLTRHELLILQASLWENAIKQIHN